MMSHTFPKRQWRNFCPANFEPADWDSLFPLLQELLERPIHSLQEFEQWILDGNELLSILREAEAIRYIRAACHTDNKQYEQELLHFASHIKPKVKPLWHQLHQKFLKEWQRYPLPKERYGLLFRSIHTQMSLFSEKNIPLEVEVAKLCQEYQKICGQMTIQWEGKELTLSQAATYLHHPDREVREKVWLLIQQRRYQDHKTLKEIFTKLYELRQQIAKNSGQPDYLHYSFLKRERFDYTPKDCRSFHSAVEKCVVPLVKELEKRRQKYLGLSELRPWDLKVDPLGRPPLKPFETVEELIQGCREIFRRLDPDFYLQFSEMAALGLLDLENRKNKAPGGFQYPLEESRYPFIFMNAVGLHRDVETLLHESGHAFHYFACCDDPILSYRHAPIEFAEVASMAMELLASFHWDVFYPQREDQIRAQRENLENILFFFPWCATIDAFQHEIYSSQKRFEELEKTWLATWDRFLGTVNWQGLEKYKAQVWQRQPHLFEFPFYYIEYGLAQLGALQLYLKAKENPKEALKLYKQALRLGGKKSLAKLYQAAHIELIFDEKKMAPIVDAVMEEIEKLEKEL